MGSKAGLKTIVRTISLLFSLGAFSTHADEGLSLDDAVKKLSEQTKGRVLVAEPTQEGDRLRYRIKLLTEDGAVQVIYVDPQTGRIEN